MSQRRMFSPDIVKSPEFLSLPATSQLLYFHLAMDADDDGFVHPQLTMRALGMTGDDNIKLLIAKRFVLPFDTGVVVIKHWLIHNMIRADRYKPTRYQDEKNSLFIKQNKAYTDKEPLGLQNGNQMAAQVRLGEVRLGNSSEAPLRVVSEVSEKPPKEKAHTTYRKVFELWGDYPLHWKANKTEIAAAKNLLVESTLEDMQWALGVYNKLKGDPYCPTILKPSDLDRKWDNLLAFKKKHGAKN